ncbi:MAG: DUF393 domain-containing protein [Terrimonas sp.]|nr:DUF393 domain-containing protein [Terrimonas sp.]
MDPVLPDNIILFDGVCNLCSGSVQFVIKRDRDHIFRFASLQSGFGQHFLSTHGLSADTFNSFILYQDGKTYLRSTAAIKVFSKLKGWKWTAVFLYVPSFIRNGIYNLIARNRYHWFGKKESCWLPTPALQEKFLD